MNEPEVGEKVMVVSDGVPRFVTVKEVGENPKSEKVVWVEEREGYIHTTQVYTKDWLNSMLMKDDEDESDDYLDYILNRIKGWDNFEELYSHKTSYYESFYLLVSKDIIKTEKRCGRLEWDLMEKFDMTKVSFQVLHKSGKDEIVPDVARKIEGEE